VRAVNQTIKSLRNSFFAGLLVVVPVAGSVMILLAVFTWLTNFMLPTAFQEKMLTPLYRVAALLLFVLLTIFVGWMTRLVLGKRMVSVTETIIGQVPLLNKTYGFMKEISHTLLAGRKTMFHHVVLVEFPRKGIYSVGFITNETEGEAQAKTEKTVVNVFVPTTPNPTSGYLILVPRDEIIRMEMSVADGMKMVISGGTVVPPYIPKTATPAPQP
jgi:uncharacterized membrane protein